MLKSIVLGVALTLIGCSSQEGARAEAATGYEIPVMSESHLDSLNRFVSAVAITTTFQVAGQGTDVRACTGVLIHPRVVLTAGHCVCHERKSIPPEASDTRFVDSSTCARFSNVKVLQYKASDTSGNSHVSSDTLGAYTGRVRVHDDLRIVYKEVETEGGIQTRAESSNADLAVIILDQPVASQVQPVKLAEQAIQLKERVLMVGYGDVFAVPLDRDPLRRYGENAVISLKEDGATFYVGRQYEIEPVYRSEWPRTSRVKGSYAEKGDSGGPCFRERKGTLELVGIARSTLSPPVVLSAYTSVTKYSEWIRQRVAEAASPRPD